MPRRKSDDDPPPLMSTEKLEKTELDLKARIFIREYNEVFGDKAIERRIKEEFKAKVAAIKLERKLEKERVAAEKKLIRERNLEAKLKRAQNIALQKK